MNKRIFNTMLFLILTTFFMHGSMSFAQEISGLYEINSNNDPSLSEILGNEIIIYKNSSNIEIFNPQKEKIAEGLISGNFISAIANNVSIQLENSDSEAVGVASLPNGEDISFTARRVHGLYQCSNHPDNSHLATSLIELQNLSQIYQCEGWRRIQ